MKQVITVREALLLIDIQNDYFPGGKFELSEPEPALAEAKNVLAYFRNEKLPVIFVKHSSPDGPFFVPGTKGAELHSELCPQEGEFVITKHAPSCFLDTELDELIEKLGINELTVCGMMTQMCVDTTVRATMDRRLPVTLLSDACAAHALVYNGKQIPAELVNSVIFASIDGTFAHVITTEGYLEGRKNI